MQVMQQKNPKIEKIIMDWTPIEYIPILRVKFTLGSPYYGACKIWHPIKYYSKPVIGHVVGFDEKCTLRICSGLHNPNEPSSFLICQLVIRKVAKKGPGSKLYTDHIFEIRLQKPKLPGIVRKRLVVVSLFGKSTNAGSRQRYEILEGSEYLIYQGRNESATGIHWVDWLVFLLPINKHIRIKWIWAGAKRLVTERVIEV